MDKIYIYLIVAGIILIMLIYLFTSNKRIVKLYNKYINQLNDKEVTGKQVAFFAKQKLNLTNLQFSLIDGKLTDCYVPQKRILCLSEEVAERPTIASVAIVAHEIGHAEQHQSKYFLFTLNNILSKITKITSRFILPCLLFGIIALIFKWPTVHTGETLLIASGILFLLAVVVKLTIIPVELDASKRALKFLTHYEIITKKEVPKVKRLLSTAGRTYIVGLFQSINPFKNLKI